MKFLEADKEIIKDELNKAYEIGNSINMWSVYYAYIDKLNCFNSDTAFFNSRFDMETFVSGLIERFERWEHTYYIRHDGQSIIKEFD